MSDDALRLLRASGWLPALLLALSLAVTPTLRLPLPLPPAARARLAGARRPLGIAAGLGALGHAVIASQLYLQSDLVSALRDIPWLRSGALALAVLVALLVTSSRRLVRAARLRLWKPLHRLAYVAAALVVHHLALAPFAPRVAVLGLALALGAGVVVRLVRSGQARSRRGQRATQGAPRAQLGAEHTE